MNLLEGDRLQKCVHRVSWVHRNVCIVCLEYTGIYLLSQFTSGVAETEMVLRRVVVDDKDFVIWSSNNFALIATDETENFLIGSSENLLVVAVVEDEDFLRAIHFEKKCVHRVSWVHRNLSFVTVHKWRSRNWDGAPKGSCWRQGFCNMILQQFSVDCNWWNREFSNRILRKFTCGCSCWRRRFSQGNTLWEEIFFDNDKVSLSIVKV